METITCPKCGKQLTGDFDFCIACGTNLKDIKKNNVLSKVSDTVAIGKKNKKTIIIISIIIVFILTAAIASYFIISNSGNKDFNVEGVTVDNVEQLSDDTYVYHMSSEQKRSFVALFDLYDVTENKYLGNKLLLMEDGSASAFLDSSRYKYKPKGYFTGCEVNENNLTDILTTYDFINDSENSKTIAAVDFNFTLDIYEDGLLFYNILTDDSAYFNKVLAISGGKGTVTNLIELDYGDTSLNVKFIPKFFVPATETITYDYNFSDDFEYSVEQYADSQVFCSSTQTVNIKNYKNGFVLYSYELMNNEGITDSQKIKYDFASIVNGKCTASTFNVLHNNTMVEPQFYIKVYSYLNWKEFGNPQNS